MGVKYLNIEFDRDVFYPGQMVSGRVHLCLDKPKELRVIEFVLTGKARCHWTSHESYTDAEGKTHSREKSHDGKESYFKTKVNLVGGKGQTKELPIGEYVYPFSVLLPAPLPPTYSGTYGEITFYGKVKLDIPWALDKSEKKYFIVESPINLNSMPEMNRTYRNEKSKTFCCWCCASGPLTVTVQIPRTAYVHNEVIPMTIEVDNCSNVRVVSVKIELHQKITWKATDDTKHEDTEVKTLKLGAVEENKSTIWTEDFELSPTKYPNTGNCGIAQIKYELNVELDANGLHTDLELKIPIVIGDIPYGGEFSNSLPPSTGGVGFVSPQPGMAPSTTGFGYNPTPGPAIGFVSTSGYLGATYPADAPQPNVGAPYPTGNTAPPGVGAPQQYPTSVEVPYPGGAGAVYPGGTPQPSFAPSYPGATSTPNASATQYSAVYPSPQTFDAYPNSPVPKVPQPSAPSDPSLETNPLLEMKPAN